MADALLVSSSFLPGTGGIESYLADLAFCVRPRLAVLAQQERDGRQMPPGLGYPVRGLPRKLRPDGYLVREIVETAKACGTNKVIFGSGWPLPLIAPRLRRYGIRYAIIVHGAELFIPAKIPFVRNRLRTSLQQAEALFPISAYTESRLRRLRADGEAPGESRPTEPSIRPLRVIIDTERFTPDASSTALPDFSDGAASTPRIVLHVGRLVKRKGVDRIIRAFPEITEHDREAMLVIAGTGPEESRLRRLAEKRGVPVRFLGRVSETDLPALYAAADVFVLPVATRLLGLEFEGLGIVLLEAAACGTPAVVGRSGGTAEAVIDGVTGFVIDARDTSQLAQRVALLLGDSDLRRRMGQAGHEYVRQNFSVTQSQTALLSWLAD